MGSSSSTQQQQTQSHTESHSDVQQAERSSRQAFTDEKNKQGYEDFRGSAAQNYKDLLNQSEINNDKYNKFLDSLNSDYWNNGGLSDTSYFNQGWGLSTGLDNGNINFMNTRSLDPYKDEATNNYIKASNEAARLAYGSAYDQASQNMIGTGMANGSGHQTAAAKVGAQLAANINAQNQQTYLQRQNQLEQNALAANNQLGNFYNTLSNIGLDYAKLSEQDLSTLLNAYNQGVGQQSQLQSQLNDALRTWGNAVEMGADPTVITEGRQIGDSVSDQNTNSTTTTKSSGGFGSILGTVLGVMPWGNLFGDGK